MKKIITYFPTRGLITCVKDLVLLGLILKQEIISCNAKLHRIERRLEYQNKICFLGHLLLLILRLLQVNGLKKRMHLSDQTV